MNYLELEKLKLEELDQDSLCVTNGGFLMALAAGFAVGAFFVAMENPRGVLDGFLDALN